ncbi:MAG: KEOPS complex N(6)-L-threonylcarbamoyladenine synthase Kae1 [Thermoprotei archaeon]
MYVLGIESTSHTFGVGIVRYDENTKRVEILSNIYKQYKPVVGGIHPREAALHHTRVAPEVLKNALEKAGIGIDQVSAIAVALGPGLGPCLRVGATLARYLAARYNKPLIPVNHAVAHIEIGKFINRFKDPLIVYVSGGNTLVSIQKKGYYRVLGETLDIPLGNLFDTFAREVGLAPPYIINGKHQIDICSEWGSRFIPLPYTVKGIDLSFSGLLTASLEYAKKAKTKEELGNICRSLRETAFNMLVEVAERALVLTGKRELLLVGGVAANRYLSTKLDTMAKHHNAKYGGTPPEYAGDNGAMIAYTGLLAYMHGTRIDPEKAFVKQRWRVDEVYLPWLENY